MSYRPPLLRLCCADGLSRVQGTSSVISLPMQKLHREDVREGGSTVCNPICQGELLEEERVTALKVVARKLAASGGQAISLEAIRLLASLRRHT